MGRATRGKERSWLVGHGVRCPLVGVTDVCREGDWHLPNVAGGRAFIFGVLERSHICGEHSLGDPTPRDLSRTAVALIDLAAWRPSEPGTVRLRRGVVAALGAWRLDAPDFDTPMRLWSTPLAWAAADFDGVVVIDWATAAPQLLGRPELVCETVALAELADKEIAKARRRLTPHRPKINILAGA